MYDKWLPPPERENKIKIKKIMKVLFLTLLLIHLWKGQKLHVGYDSPAIY